MANPQPFPGAPRTRATLNTFTQKGAEELAARIRAYWNARGHDVSVRVTASSKWSTTHYVVSDLVDGWPRAKQTLAQRLKAERAPEKEERAA